MKGHDNDMTQGIVNTLNPLHETVRFLVVLFTAIMAYYLLFPILKTIGLPDLAGAKTLDEFVQKDFHSTNGTFLYCSGCVILMVTFLLYQKLIFPKILPKITLGFKKWLRIESQKADRILTQCGCIVLALSAIGLLYFFRKHVFVGIWGTMGGLFKPIPAALFILFLFLFRQEKKFTCSARRTFDAVAIFGIAILTFRTDVHYFDFSNFLSAVNNIVLGKDILANVICHYGFFNIYFLASIIKILGVRDAYAALAIVNSVFYVLGYSFIYILLRVYTRQVILSILAIFSIIAVNFFLFPNVPSHWTPSVGFLRFGTIFPVLCLLISDRLKQNKYWGWFLAFFVVLAVFWVIETGIYILMSIVGVAIFQYLFCADPHKRKTLLKVLPKIAVLFIATIAVLTARIYLKYGIGPVWEDLVYYQKFYLAGGLGVKALTDFYLWPAVMLLYWIAVYTCLIYYDKVKHADAWLFLGFFGLQSLLYYVSIVIIDHLARAALPATILFFVFWGYIARENFTMDFRFLRLPGKYAAYFVVIFFSLWMGSVMDKYGDQKTLGGHLIDNPREFIKNMRTDSVDKFFPKRRAQEFRYDVAKIKELIPAGAPLAIISKHDTLYQIYSQRRSLFKIAFYPSLSYTKEQIPEAAETILKSNQKYLFVDNSPYHCYNNIINPNNASLQLLVSKYYRKVESLGLLDLYERQ